MSIKQRRYLFLVLISVAIYLICFAMYTRVSSVNRSLRYLQEHMSIGGHNTVNDRVTSARIESTHQQQLQQGEQQQLKQVQEVQADGGHPPAVIHEHEATVAHQGLNRMVTSPPPENLNTQQKVDTELKFPCIDRLAVQFGRVEDVFCTSLGKLDPRFKNPCFYDYRENGVKRLRCLPYFYIFGPDKCGTTDLHSRMVNHPQLMDNDGIIKKEASFWGWRHFGNMNWKPQHRNETVDGYMNIFGRTAHLLETGGPEKANVVTGDASPMDFYDFHYWYRTPQNWGKTEPEVVTPMLIRGLHAKTGHIPKMITQLRDPIERIFSFYVFLGGGNNPEKFHRDVEDSMEKMKRCIAERGQRLCFFDGPLFHSMRVKLQTSCYHVYIKEWLAAFPRKSVHIIRLEDTSANMKQALKDIYSFLELEPLSEDTLDEISGVAKKHVTKAKVGVTMLPKTAELLKEFYKPCNEELARMLQDNRYLWEDMPHDH